MVGVVGDRDSEDPLLLSAHIPVAGVRRRRRLKLADRTKPTKLAPGILQNNADAERHKNNADAERRLCAPAHTDGVFAVVRRLFCFHICDRDVCLF